jgi:hypothetical protein
MKELEWSLKEAEFESDTDVYSLYQRDETNWR